MSGAGHDREELDAGAALLRSAWRGEAEERRLLDEIVGRTGLDGYAQGAAALAPQEAVSVAVLGEREQLMAAEGAFATWFPEPSAMPDLRRLAAKARREGAALGLLQAADGAALATWTVSGPAAEKWARSEPLRRALAGPGRVLALVFAPSRSSELAARAVAAFGLSPLESRLAEAFLFAPSLEVAATQAGVGRETARDAMARIMAKTGARRSTEVVRRLADLMSAVHDHEPATPARLAEAFGLTPAEASVALRLAAGAMAKEIAADLGLAVGTVQTYAKSVLSKCGVARAKDLARLAAETEALAQLTSVAEPVFTSGAPAGRLRLMPRPDGRRVAFLDYGPASGEPTMIFHGFMAGRSVPPALVRALHVRGLRPLVLQRPGFGLATPAAGDYLKTATDDLRGLVEALGAERIRIFARDGGTAAALHYASRYPQSIARGVLLNPRSPEGLAWTDNSKPVSRLARAILSHPHAVAGLGELIRRRTRSDYLEAGLRQTLRGHAGDVAALEDPAVRAQLVRDMQAQFAHSSAGYVAEHGVYAKGWTLPQVAGGGPWTVVSLGAFGAPLAETPWLGLPGIAFAYLADAGVLAQFTHAEPLGALIGG